MSTENLLNYFYTKDVIVLDDRKVAKVFNPDQLAGVKATRDVRHPTSNELIVKEGRKFTRTAIKQMEAAGIKQIPIAPEEVVGRVVAHDIVDPATGEVLIECNQEVTPEKLKQLRDRNIHEIEVLLIDDLFLGPSLRNTLLQDKINTPEEAILEIYKRLRPGDPPTLETATSFFNNLFFNPERYDLSKVGRLKLNHKLRQSVPLEQGTLRREDILEVVRYLMELKNGNGQVDDIDHLGNRRIRAVGELVENQYRIGLVRMERAIKERMSLQDIETLMPQELINYKPVSAVIKEFFGSSPAVAVHGPDEPAIGDHSQASLVRVRAGRPDARTRRFRSPRRSPHALRSRLSDRDAGRTEHRSDRQSFHLCSRERVRVHRNAVPTGRRRKSHRPHPLSLGARRRKTS